jgi:hypothetical protein
MQQVQALNIDVLTGAVNPMPQVKDAGDEFLWVTFESASHFNDVATREQGRPIFEMRDYIKIIVPGDSTQVVHRPVRDTDKQRWPNQWLAFTTGKEQSIGFPLSEWPYLTRAQIDELKYFKIDTVEQLAHVSDTACQKFMGLKDLREKANTYLQQMKGEEPLARVLAEKAAREEENKALQAQIADLQAAVQQLLKKKPKGRKAGPNDGEDEDEEVGQGAEAA